MAAFKVLDFGLATMGGTPGARAEHASTATTVETKPGTILGAVAYMSAEQASGKLVDNRAEIWAFGVALWEMLTGKRLFAGETPKTLFISATKKTTNKGSPPLATSVSKEMVSTKPMKERTSTSDGVATGVESS